MTTLAEMRVRAAGVLTNAHADLTVTPRPVTNNLRYGDGWIVVDQLQPRDYTSTSATLAAVIVLGSDPVLADEKMDTLGVVLVDALTYGLYAADVRLAPEVLPAASAGNPGALYVATLTFTTEVTAM